MSRLMKEGKAEKLRHLRCDLDDLRMVKYIYICNIAIHRHPLARRLYRDFFTCFVCPALMRLLPAISAKLRWSEDGLGTEYGRLVVS